jgi:hypothetical protein
MIDVSSSPRLSAILRLVDELPDELITVSGDDYNRLTDSVETIRNVLEMWTSHGSTAFYLPTRLRTHKRAFQSGHFLIQGLRRETIDGSRLFLAERAAVRAA